jgi:filamin
LSNIIKGSPFALKVYDASRIIVSELLKAEANKPCEFTIDASGAGEGQLEITINDGLVKNSVKQIRPGHYLVTFYPTVTSKSGKDHLIEVKFNNELVPGLASH